MRGYSQVYMEKIYYNELDKLFLVHFKRKLNEAKKVIITCHKDPDDDAIASMLAIYEYVTQNSDVKTEMKVTGLKKRERWNIFKHYEHVEFVSDLYDELSDEDLLILLDGSKWYRFSNKEEMSNFEGDTICIDHHPVQGNSFKLSLIAPQYTSTAEIIYRVFFQKTEINQDLAEIILMGIIGDTGTFNYLNEKTANTLSIAEYLIKAAKIDIQQFKASYSNYDKRSYELLKEYYKRSKIKKIEEWPEFMYSSLTQKIVEENEKEIVSEANDLFRYYLTNLKGVSWGFVVIPSGRGSKISLRSIPGSVNVRELAEDMGIGGGHDNASGGFIEKEPAEAIKTILSHLKKNEPNIQKNI